MQLSPDILPRSQGRQAELLTPFQAGTNQIRSVVFPGPHFKRQLFAQGNRFIGQQ
jgi:hypothetical protein